MSNISVSAILIGAAILFQVILATHVSAQEQIYFACEGGWSFAVNENAARCYRPEGYIEYSGPDAASYPACMSEDIQGTLVKFHLDIDFGNTALGHMYGYQPNQDVCTGDYGLLMSLTREATCPDRYPQHFVPKRDNCASYSGSPRIEAPSVKVFRKEEPEEPSAKPIFGVIKR